MSRISIFLFLFFSINFYSQENNKTTNTTSRIADPIEITDPDDPIELDPDPIDPPCRNYYYDRDGDGYGDGLPECLTYQPVGWVKFNEDCDDNDPNIYPRWWFLDNDSDGYGISSDKVKDCYQPAGRVSVAGDCKDNNSSIHPNTVWYSDSDSDGFGDPLVSITQCNRPIGYVLNNLDLCPQVNGGILSSNGCARFSDENYVYEVTLLDDVSDASQISNTALVESIEYYDGLGRSKQKILISSGGQRQDIVTHSEYDAMGRKTKDFLPFASSGSSNGLIYNNPLSETFAYYNTLKYDYTTNPYSENRFESSPLSRTLEVASPGIAWQLDPINDNDHTVKMDYEFNTTSDKVRRFGVSIDALGNYNLIDNSYYLSNELYKNIVKNENWQPTQTYLNDNVSIEFKDKLDRIILKRNHNNNKWHDTYYVYDDLGNLTFVLSPEINTYDLSQQIWPDDSVDFEDVEWYYSSNPTGGFSNFTDLSLSGNILDFSFNNYDNGPNVPLNTSSPVFQFSNIGFDVNLPDMPLGPVTIKLSDGSYSSSHYSAYIQNGAVYLSGDGTVAYGVSIGVSIDLNTLTSTSAPIISVNDINKFGYQYKYDEKKRLVEKKLPGKDWEYIVYDELDRPILTQDANLKSQNKWLFTKYDIFNRVVYTGMWTNPIAGQQRIAVQNAVNTQSNPVWHESKLAGTANNINGTVIMYTVQSFPNTISSLDVYSIQYYDDYNFDIVGLNSEPSFGITPTTNVKKLSTGSKTRVLDTNQWITTISYYDEKARTIFITTLNAYTGVLDKIKTKLDFTGNVLESENVHSKSGLNITIRDFFTYDHSNRMLSHKQKINSLPEQLIVKNQYDELGKLIRKDVGNSETNPLQKVDYNYNIRGWLKGINNIGRLGDDLFNYNINYQDANTPYQYNGGSGSALYNGNISSVNWSTNNSSTSVRSYFYKYDALNRIKDANYGENDIVTNKFYEQVNSYDRNGNIKALFRNSANPTSPSSTYGVGVDGLEYSYDGNRLIGVKDHHGLSVNGVEGFKDSNTVGDDFTYDANGNLKTDKNKGITSIEYNHLNLPVKIVFNNQDPSSATYPKAILYKYDAIGTRIEKKVLEPKLISGIQQNTASTTIYSGNFIYENNTLQFFSHPEGYVAHNAGNFSYIYQYKDHLGNVRLTYSDANNDGEIIGATSEVFYDGFENGSGWEGATYPGSSQLTSYDTVKKRSGQYSGKIENFSSSEYTVHQNNWIPISITQPTEFIFSAWVYSDNPSAELFLFQNKAADQGYGYRNEQVVTTQKNRWVYIEKKVMVQPDITRLLLRLDNNGGGTVWFDDVSIRKVNSTNEIVEENNYYAFGLKHKHINNVFNLNNANPAAQKYKYNGKELQEELGLNMYDYGARNYDPALGRWMNIDPLAEKATDWTPYRYAFNNPLRFVDPDGKWEIDANGNLIAQKNDNAYSLAKYLNTDSRTAINMLSEQGYTVNKNGILNLKVGDVFQVENTTPKPKSRENLHFTGNNIRDRAGSEFSKNMFENYWKGEGDVELSGKRFAGILMFVKEKNPKIGDPLKVKLNNGDGTFSEGNARVVNFYTSSEYDKVFGSATLYYNKQGNVVGFYDFYDFDSKPWGQRSTKNEIITRAVEMVSPSIAKAFSIFYGQTNK